LRNYWSEGKTVTAVAQTVSETKLLEGCSSEEWTTRVNLAAAYRLVAHFGWDDLIFTHISARVPGPEHHFLINPYGLLFEEITASSLIKIDLDGNVMQSTPYSVNPAGFTIHSAIHAVRDDARCVLHLHTPAGMAVSAQAKGLLPLNQTALTVIDELAYHDYEGLAFNLEERPRLVADLGAKSAMLLRNHGTLTLGPSVAAAFLTMYMLERACATQVATLAGGAEIHWPTPEVQALVQRQVVASRGTAEVLAWTPLLRLLDRKDPSYKT